MPRFKASMETALSTVSWLALLLCFGCSALYDADEFQLCEPLDDIGEPPCATAIAVCLSSCVDDDSCTRCYDANGDGDFDEAEIACYSCTIQQFYRCGAENGCSREIEAISCCGTAMCGLLGCPEEENPCQAESESLNTCFFERVGDACNDSALGCFVGL